jgi:hypothetical protein
MSEQCPLYPQKRTLIERFVMSALCQKQTFPYPAEVVWRLIARRRISKLVYYLLCHEGARWLPRRKLWERREMLSLA